MRRGKRRKELRYNRNRQNYHNDILLAEFRYYNKKTEIIPPKELDVIEKKIIKKPSKVIFWTNTTFGNHNTGFTLFMKEKKINIGSTETKEENVYIRMEKFKGKLRVGSFNKLENVYDNKIFLSFIPDDWMIEMFEGFDLEQYQHPITNGYMEPPFNNWNDIVNHFIESKTIDKFAECEDNEWEEYKTIVKKVFNHDILKPKVMSSDRDYYNNFEGTSFIIDVIEKRINEVNYRIALLANIGNYTRYDMKVVNETHEDYVYFDKGKLFITTNSKRFFFDDTTLEFNDGKLLVDIKLMNQISKNINQILPVNEKIITPMIYRFYRERVLTSTFNKNALTEKEMALIKRYKELLTEDKAIKINQVYLSKYMIQVAGEGFKLEFDPNFINVLDKFAEIKRLIKSDVIYNFNEFYEGLLKLSILHILDREYFHDSQYKKFQKAEFKINDMDIVVSKDSSRARINGIFCRIDDILHILNKCICYHDVNEFNKYVRDVSYIGVEWKKMISNGIALQLHNPIHKLVSEINPESVDNLYLRFSMYWDADKRSQVYLKLADEKYLIKYKGKFKRHFNVPRRSLTIEKLKHELKESIPNLDDTMLLEIIDNAVEEAKIVRKRGLELVANTIRDIEAKETIINIKGNEIQGYLFFGRVTKSQYFVQKIQLTVFKYIDGSWNRRCIVDDHSKQRIYEDRLANRLVNIYNEPTYLKNFLKT